MPNWFPKHLHQLQFYEPCVNKLEESCSFQHLVILAFKNVCQLNICNMLFTVGLICFTLITKETKHLFICLLAIRVSSPTKCPFHGSFHCFVVCASLTDL